MAAYLRLSGLMEVCECGTSTEEAFHRWEKRAYCEAIFMVQATLTEIFAAIDHSFEISDVVLIEMVCEKA